MRPEGFRTPGKMTGYKDQRTADLGNLNEAKGGEKVGDIRPEGEPSSRRAEGIGGFTGKLELDSLGSESS